LAKKLLGMTYMEVPLLEGTKVNFKAYLVDEQLWNFVGKRGCYTG